MKLSALLTTCLFGAWNICDAVLPHWGVATLTKNRSRSHPTTQAFANNKSPLYQGAASKKRRVNVSPRATSESKGGDGTATGGEPGVSNASAEPNHTPPSATATAVGGVPVSTPASEQAPSESPTGPSIPTAPTADDAEPPARLRQESPSVTEANRSRSDKQQSTTGGNGSSDEVPTITDGTDGEGPSTTTDSTDSESHQQKESHEDARNENDNQDKGNESDRNDFSPDDRAWEPLVNDEEEGDEEEQKEEEEEENEDDNKAQVSKESTNDLSDEERKCVDDLVDLVKGFVDIVKILPLDSRDKMLEKTVVAVCLTKE